MRKTTIAAALLAAVLITTGCRHDKISQPVDTVICEEGAFTAYGNKVFDGNPQTWQSGMNISSNTFFFQSDSGEEWVTVKLSDIPGREGDRVDADFEWLAPGMDKTKKVSGIEMETVAVENSDDLIYLWNSKQSIGICIQNVRK